MTLENIKGMTEYLENDCYCPYEIYDTSGFFYQLFKPETPCELLAESKYGEHCLIFVAARPSDEFGSDKTQILCIEQHEGKIYDCFRYDATDHNIKETKLYATGKINRMNLNEYAEHDTVKEIRDIFEKIDAIMV